MIINFQNETKNLINTVINLTYYMRGSIQYDRILGMSYAERQQISNFIEKRMEAQKKINYPIL